jgi:hypothetical protein
LGVVETDITTGTEVAGSVTTGKCRVKEGRFEVEDVDMVVVAVVAVGVVLLVFVGALVTVEAGGGRGETTDDDVMTLFSSVVFTLLCSSPDSDLFSVTEMIP